MPRTNAVADHVIAVAQTDSTNALARRILRDGELTLPADGVGMTVVAADEQTAGRGRIGRTWVSQPRASMTCSFVTALPMNVLTDAAVNGWLPMIAGLAALDALRGTLEECGLKPNAPDCTLALKWPNDIYCHGLKLGGILAEFVPLDDTAQAANTADAPRAALIIGIGVNLHLRSDRLPTPSSTSLQLHVDNLPDTNVLRDMICARIASSLRNRLYAFAREPHAQAAAVHDEALRVCWTINRRVEARFTDGTTLTGTAVALNADASLQVRDDTGELHTVHTADVGVM